MLWTYKTKTGIFWIKPDTINGFSLGIDDELLGSYINPEQAADDVYMCATGYWDWDQQLTVMEPESLSEWEFHKRRGL